MRIHQYSLLDHFDWDSFQFEDWNEEWTIDDNGRPRRKTKEEILLDKAKKHKGMWLTSENMAKEYFLRGKQLRDAIRALIEEFRITYDLTELEAKNIINGYHISDYVRKYKMLKEFLDAYEKEEATLKSTRTV